jgi:hypothetical protein
MNGPPEGRIQMSALNGDTRTPPWLFLENGSTGHVEPLILIDGRIMKAGVGHPRILLDIKVIRSLPWDRVDYKSCRSLSLIERLIFETTSPPEVLVSGRIPAAYPAGHGKIGCS